MVIVHVGNKCVYIRKWVLNNILLCDFISMQGVSVEAVDPVFQAKMLDMLKQTGRWVMSHFVP